MANMSGTLSISRLLLLLVASATLTAATSGQLEEAEDLIPLNFMYVTSLNSSSFRSAGTVPAVDLALERVNADPTLLQGYKLQYTTLLDSECSRNTALDVFFDELRRINGTQYIAILGCGCSVATEPIAEVNHYFNIPLISYASSAEVLRNRERFPNYFRLAPSEESFAPGLAGMVHSYNWRRLAFITQRELLFQDTQRDVIELLDGMTSVKTHIFGTFEDPLALENLFFADQDIRVFVLNMYSNHARRVLCQAYKEGLFYPEYAWITLGWYRRDWWSGEGGACNGTAMAAILNNSLSILQYPIVDLTAETEVGSTSEKFLEEYYDLLALPEYSHLVPTVTSPLAYDAIWALALALNSTVGDVTDEISPSNCKDFTGGFTPLENFTYSNAKVGCIVHEYIQATNFTGVSGRVWFDEHGTRQGNTVRVEQYRAKEGEEEVDRLLVAHLIDEGSTLIYSNGENDSTVFPAGVPPDGTPITTLISVEVPLIVVYTILSLAGIGLALLCLIFNLIFRKRKIVRLTSPNLNYVIIAGAVMIYICVIIQVVPLVEVEGGLVLCSFRIWLAAIGNTLCFGVIVAKIWRVNYIFSGLSAKKNPHQPKDWHLFIIVCVLVAIEIIILLVPTAIGSSRLQPLLFNNSERPLIRNSDGIKEIFQSYHCTSNNSIIWLAVSYTYLFLLQLIAMFYAYRSRKVRIKALNDSKEIAAIIYVSTVVLLVQIGTILTIQGSFPNVYAAIVGITRLLYPTVILAILFIPKMVKLYRDPKGENIFSQNSASQNSDPMVKLKLPPLRDGGSSGCSDRVRALEAKIAELELQIQKAKGATVTDQNSPVSPVSETGFLLGASESSSRPSQTNSTIDSQRTQE